MRTVWKTSRREIAVAKRPLVMAILNVTPDSFSDGGRHLSVASALAQAEKFIAEGADIIDIGGESTRPGSERVSAEDEAARVLPVVEAIAAKHDIPISVDTTRPTVATGAINAGAEIINDISGLRWEPEMAGLVEGSGAGLVIMHSRGTFETMHQQPPVDNIIEDVEAVFEESIATARNSGIDDAQVVLDVGLGFGKTFEQNLELIANLDKIVDRFPLFPLLVGVSRKSFIGRILNDAPVSERLGGSLAAALAAVKSGARLLRVHDVRETVAAISVYEAIEAHNRK
jgi:dihydropteroate synthase